MNSTLTNGRKDRYVNGISRLLLMVAAVLVLAATGCKHTAHGVGEDMEKAGEKIQEKTR